ncbi:hypothetical protein GQ53DRAFT_761647 [Thozetella sp. PMI_491]|nr:hypothetical protein GQ53DRAFT_761647 [Thozetella sp. PMI_491]
MQLRCVPRQAEAGAARTGADTPDQGGVRPAWAGAGRILLRETAKTDIQSITDPAPPPGAGGGGGGGGDVGGGDSGPGSGEGNGGGGGGREPPKAARLRLGYRKSRTGCLRCKARRVKCDENRPCSACVRHGVECSLQSGPASQSGDGESYGDLSSSQASGSSYLADADWTPGGTPDRPLAPSHRPLLPAVAPPAAVTALDAAAGARLVPPEASTAGTPDRSPSVVSAQTPDSYGGSVNVGSSSGRGVQPAEDLPSAWVSDLELMHHFTTCTYQSLPRARESMLAALWQTEVPRLAFNHVFLLHQVLATAAFHLACLNPPLRPKYSLLASHHQELSIQGIRAHIGTINADNCHALFAASSLLSIGGFGALACSDEPAYGPALDDLLEEVMLLRGIDILLRTSTNFVSTGPLRALFARHPPSELNEPAHNIIGRARLLAAQIAGVTLDNEVRRTLEGELEGFVHWIHRGFETTNNPSDPELRVALAWPIGCSDHFVSLARQRHPVALALLSLYCCILYRTEQQFWYTRGWAYGLLRDIAPIISPPWGETTDWALRFIGAQSVAHSPMTY